MSNSEQRIIEILEKLWNSRGKDQKRRSYFIADAYHDVRNKVFFDDLRKKFPHEFQTSTNIMSKWEHAYQIVKIAIMLVVSSFAVYWFLGG